MSQILKSAGFTKTQKSREQILSNFYGVLKAISLYKIFAKFSVEPVYPTMVGGKCQIYGVYITGQKIKSTYIRKTFPLVFIFTPQTERNNSFPGGQHFSD